MLDLERVFSSSISGMIPESPNLDQVLEEWIWVSLCKIGKQAGDAVYAAFQADEWNGLQRTQALWHWWTVRYCLPNLTSTQSHTHILLCPSHRSISHFSFLFSQFCSDSSLLSLIYLSFLHSSLVSSCPYGLLRCFLTVLYLDRTLLYSLFLKRCCSSLCPCLHTHQHTHKHTDSYNHFTRSSNHYFVWRTQGKGTSQQSRTWFTSTHTNKK